MNKEQLQFFYDEIMGMFDWEDGDTASGVDPLLWAKKQIRDKDAKLAQLRTELDAKTKAVEEVTGHIRTLIEWIDKHSAPNKSYAYYRCSICNHSWWGGADGLFETERHEILCPVPDIKKLLNRLTAHPEGKEA